MSNDTVLSQLLKTTIPWATATDNLDVSKLPTLARNDRTNAMLWNTLGTTTATVGVVTLLKVLANKRHRKKWDKKSKEIVESKVNSLYPITAPNYEKKLSSVSDVRKVGLGSLTKSASAIKGRGLYDWLKDNAEVVAKGSLPIAALITAAALTPTIVDDKLEKKNKRDIDAENLEKRNQLDALRAKMIELGLSKRADGWPPFSIGLGTMGALGTVLAGAFAAKHFKDRDKSRKIMEALEGIASENSTNIPQRVSIKFNSDGRPAKSAAEQTYIKKLLEHAEKADKDDKKDEDSKKDDKDSKKLENKDSDKADFEDKVTKMKKEELFS